MSHTVKVTTNITDVALVQKTAQLVDAKFLGVGTHKLYSSSHAGIGVQLPGWRYPVVFMEDGQCAQDTYGGQWGRDEVLHGFQQEYAVQAALRQFEQNPAYRDATITRNRLENGEVELVATLAGGGGGETSPCDPFQAGNW